MQSTAHSDCLSLNDVLYQLSYVAAVGTLRHALSRRLPAPVSWLVVCQPPKVTFERRNAEDGMAFIQERIDAELVPQESPRVCTPCPGRWGYILVTHDRVARRDRDPRRPTTAPLSRPYSPGRRAPPLARR